MSKKVTDWTIEDLDFLLETAWSREVNCLRRDDVVIQAGRLQISRWRAGWFSLVLLALSFGGIAAVSYWAEPPMLVQVVLFAICIILTIVTAAVVVNMRDMR